MFCLILPLAAVNSLDLKSALCCSINLFLNDVAADFALLCDSSLGNPLEIAKSYASPYAPNAL
jgi:hypothetical protein